MFACPGCGAGLDFDVGSARCSGCAHEFEVEDGIPLLYWDNDWEAESADVTKDIRSFYEETPFPNYANLDDVAQLAHKAKQGLFANLLDQQIPPGSRIIECGCGTGQLSNFLATTNRVVFGADLCHNSLRLAEEFRAKNNLSNVRFLQMNLFRPAFKPGSFDLVISNGVLHHTSRPREAFASISKLVKPGGYLLVGLYHRYGRLVTDARRVLFRLTGGAGRFLDPHLRKVEGNDAKYLAWYRDQYENPHESKHTIAEVSDWIDELGFEFVRSIPSAHLFQPFVEGTLLFAPEEPAVGAERMLAELGFALQGSREGGLFTVIARRPETQL